MNDKQSLNPDEEPVIISDRRRIDPETGQARATEPDPETESNDLEDSSLGISDSEDNPQVEELTKDLQRLQAEFSNYRKRVERDQASLLDLAKANVLTQFLPILDDLDRAREHGDLDTDPLKSISENLLSVVNNFKIEKFATAGEVFDPNLHEAVQNTGTGGNLIIDSVLRDGYRLGDKILRTAMVTVTDEQTS